MLKTPLGFLYVYRNNEPIEYDLKPLPLKPIEISSYEVDARYTIEIDKSKICEGDIISFEIDTDLKFYLDKYQSEIIDWSEWHALWRKNKGFSFFVPYLTKSTC